MTCYSKFTRLRLALGLVMSQGTTRWACPGSVCTFRSVAGQTVERVEKGIMGNEVLLQQSASRGIFSHWHTIIIIIFFCFWSYNFIFFYICTNGAIAFHVFICAYLFQTESRSLQHHPASISPLHQKFHLRKVTTWCDVAHFFMLRL